jgi:putative NADH-flavin reductase
MTDTHVVAICGSLRDESHTRKALAVALIDEAEHPRHHQRRFTVAY